MRTSVYLLRLIPAAFVATFIGTLMLTGCDVHEFVDDPAAPNKPIKVFRLTLRHDQALPLLGKFSYAGGSVNSTSRSTGPEEEARPHWIRYTINAYESSRGEVSRAPQKTYVFSREFSNDLDTTVEIALPEGDYRLIAWTDYVDHGSSADKYYNTSDFAEIILAHKGTHYGSNRFRDSFYGSVETSVSNTNASGSVVKDIIDEAIVDMKRPVARYTFISTDLRRFLESEGKAARLSGSLSKNSPALGDYRVRFVYTRYMPCSFNTFTGKPADSWTGVEFESRIVQTSDHEAQIGFDYVFVNGNHTAATVGLEVMDRQGNLLARIPPFDVPLERSRHTIVKGEFLTTKSGGAMGIDPDFDGEFNIEIE